MARFDLAIIGAGPAGMAAAATAAAHGLTVTVLDEAPRAGGQIYRSVDEVPEARGRLLGKEYLAGRRLTAGLEDPGITHLAGASVWSLEGGFEVAFTQGGRATEIDAKRLLLAAGALERPMPLPGWTLPGVMTVGAAQILVKQSGLAAQNAVMVGSGPLLYLTAAQMVRAGSPPLALVETQGPGDLLRALRLLPGARSGWREVVKGLALLAELRRAGVPRYLAARAVRIEGTSKTEAVRFEARGKAHRIACSTVLLHHGVVPNTHAGRAIGVPHEWSERQRSFVPVCDAWGETPVKGVFIAGDGAGIVGAAASETAGRLAALEIAADLGALSHSARDDLAAPLRHRLARETALRPFLDAAYPPADQALNPEADTIICRCEEVTAGQVRALTAAGCVGPNEAKAQSRVGMGPCQGRFCGLTLTEILSHATGQTPDQTGHFRIRPPIRPVTLGELAGNSAKDDAGAEDQVSHGAPFT